MQWARGKYSTLITGGIIGFIGFVFVVSGVFNPKATRGLHEGAVAGTVNGDPISISEFNRSLNQRMEFFKNMMGGKVSDEQLKAFRIRESVFQELVNRKVMVQEAARQGVEASDEEVRDRIREIPAFQKDGKFDVTTYRRVLESNNYTPGGFEKMMREDLSAQAWQSYFQSRAMVSDGEIKQQFMLANDKRNIKYVQLTAETGRHGVKIDQAEVDKFLADPAKLNLAKSQYEAKKNHEYKGKDFDAVKGAIAREALAGDKSEEIRKLNEKLADQVAAALSADKKSDAQVNALLKQYKTEVKSTGLVSRDNRFLPGINEAQELLKDAFAAQSPIDPAQGGKAKKYSSPAGIVVAVVSETQKPDLSKLEAERMTLHRQISSRKQRELYQDWIKKLTANASVDPNPQVVGEEES